MPLALDFRHASAGTDGPLAVHAEAHHGQRHDGVRQVDLARQIGEQLNLPYTELDSLFHGPGWTPRDSFVEDVDRLTGQTEWVTEFQYDQARPMLVERADLMVWLDISRGLVMWRVARRTVSRRWRRTELWNGNREAPLRTFFSDPEHIIRWAWSTHPTTAERARDALRRRPELVAVRLTSTAEVESWLDGPAGASSRG